MSALLIIAAIVAVVFLFTGLFVTAVKFLLWVGIVLLIAAGIAWLLRSITGSKKVV